MVRDTAADDVLVVGDRVQLDRAMVNLLSNAVKFTPEGGQVTLSTEVCGDEVCVWVSDTGVGIPKAEQEKVFSRFFRASNAFQSSIPGTGLGLSLVAAVVKKHDGRMELVSEVGMGTTMVVHLPLAPTGSSRDASCTSTSSNSSPAG
jgi:signal transduction histidine kinase